MLLFDWCQTLCQLQITHNKCRIATLWTTKHAALGWLQLSRGPQLWRMEDNSIKCNRQY